MDFLGRKMALEFFFYMIPRLQEAKGLENPAFIDINCIWLDIHECSQNEAMQRKNAITGCLNRAPGASPDSNLPGNIQNQKRDHFCIPLIISSCVARSRLVSESGARPRYHVSITARSETTG